MDQALEVLESIIVEKVRGKWLGEVVLRDWLKRNWQAKLNYSTEARILAKGWLSFFLHTKEDMDWVLGEQWFSLGTPMVLK